MKKALFSLLVITLVFSLCACSKEKNGTTSVVTEATKQTSAVSEVPEPEPSEDINDEVYSVIGATADQVEAIRKELSGLGIEPQSIANGTYTMETGEKIDSTSYYRPYEVTAEDGKVYTIIIADEEANRLETVFDADGERIWGGLPWMNK